MQKTLELYHMLFENNPLPMWVYDRKTLRFLMINKAAIDLYGYPEEEFLSKTVNDLYLSKPGKNETETKLEARHIKKNGEVFSVDIRSSFLNFNEIPVAQSTVIDITDKEILRQSEASFRSFVENSEDMTMRFDREYRHLYANPASEKYLNIKVADFIGKNHEELGFRKEQYEYWDQKIEEVFQSGKTMRIVSDINPDDFCFHWDLIPEFSTDGNVASVLSITRDITDLIKAKKALEDHTEKLRESNATKDKLFSIIAHDLRGPIGSIEQVLHLINNDTDLSEDEKRYFLKELLKATKTANELLNNLLVWAKSQLNGIEFKPVKFTIKKVVNQNLELLASNAKLKSIRFQEEIEDNLTVYADLDLVYVVVRNLISNAVKFTPENGTIIVSAKDLGNETEVSVSDTGIGMSPEVLEKIFKPNVFYTSLGTNNEKGSGLGLLLCKDFVEQNGGKIRVESHLKKGSRFVFSLPKG